MTESPRRRRGHAAASARILTGGLSSAAALGMVAGMALTAGADQEEVAPAAPPGIDRRPLTTPIASGPQEVIVVVRRHWASVPITVPAAGPAPLRPSPPVAVPATGSAPLRGAAPPTAAQLAPRKPGSRPITRTRSS